MKQYDKLEGNGVCGDCKRCAGDDAFYDGKNYCMLYRRMIENRMR